MTNEERDLLTSFVQRVSGVGAPGQLPPLDPEADRLLADLFTRAPEARYRMTQTAFVQEAALHQAQAQIQQLQADLAQARAAASSPPAEAGRPSGFFGGMFGGGQPAAAPVAPRPNPWGQAPAAAYAPPPAYPQPAYPQPAYQPPPQMMQPGGTGFFGSAVRTAAGVAGGMVLGNALMNMFSGPHMGGGFGGMGGLGGGMGGFAGAPVNETIINNYNEPPPGGAPQDAGWDQPASDPGGDSGWQDASDSDPGFGGGGFDDSTDV